MGVKTPIQKKNFMTDSDVVWTSRPSQWVNLRAYTGAGFCLILFIALESAGAVDAAFNLPALKSFKGLFKTILFLLPIIFAVKCWLQVHFHVYELTEEVFREHYGILNRVSQELELYRVNDTMILKPFDLNVLGLGNIVMHTSDASTPVVTIQAVRYSDKLREHLRKFVETQRIRRGIVEVGNQ
jgi:uncharacterized membrane protein YdbT with pleckstrin-like domain